jgi:DNA-binding NarL/FixJ family response regulator
MLKILIADDHPIFRQGLKQVLARESDLHVVGEAGNAREALEEVTKQHYDVILLDISMPGESGLSIIRQLKQIDKDLSVLVLSMHPEEQYAVQALKAGAAAYLTKVSVPDELVNAIRKVATGGKYISSTLAEKLAYAIEEPHKSLSTREFEIMRMLALGKTVSEIAKELFLSIKTVSTHRTHILQKLDLSNTADLIRYARQNKLVD